MSPLKTISVIGAGAWGTALANAVAAADRSVILYARDAAAAEQLATTRLNPKLPGIRINDDVIVTADIARTTSARTDPDCRAGAEPARGDRRARAASRRGARR